MNPQRGRIEDHNSDQHWPQETVNSGITNRLLVAGPDSTLMLREGTDNLIFDDIHELTWGDIMEILTKAGIFRFTPDLDRPLTFQKRAVGFGKHNGERLNRPNNLRKLVDLEIQKMDDSCDLNEPDQLKNFIFRVLSREERKTHFKRGARDFKEQLPEIARSIFDCFSRLGANFTAFHLAQAGPSLISTIQFIITDCVGYTEKAEYWAGPLFDAIYHHPSLKRGTP